MLDDNGSETKAQERPIYLPPNMKTAALRIAGKGKPVFPCRSDKSPHTARGFLDATIDPAKANAYWNRYPDAMIGMPTRQVSGVFVIDVDRPEALEELEQELPETLTARTPSGGLHLYFHHAAGISNSPGGLPKGIDVRGEGGYVIVPPSSGYLWEDHSKIAEAPAWLLNLIREKQKRTGPDDGDLYNNNRHRGDPGDSSDVGLDNVGPIREGRRNNTLTSIGGKLRADGCKHAEILDALTFVNQRRCEPTLPKAEVEQIARSVARYPKGAASMVSPETKAAVDRYQEVILHGRSWTRTGDLSVRDVIAAIILKALRFGWLDEDGNVIVSISYRELALEAATRLETAYKAVARAKRAGLLASANAGRRRGQAGAFKLLIPRRAYPEHSDHVRETGGAPTDGKSVPSVRAPLLRHHAPGYWRLGKGGAVVVHYLESLPGRSASLRKIANALGMRRWRDLYRTGPNPRGRLWRLEEAGVVEVTGDRVSLVEDYLARIDCAREEGGEFEARRNQIRRFNLDRRVYHGEPMKLDRAPSEQEMEDHRFARPLLVGDAARAHAAIMDQKTRPGRVYATRYGDNPDVMSCAVAAHFGDSRGDPQAWRRWLDPVAQALSAMEGEVRQAVTP